MPTPTTYDDLLARTRLLIATTDRVPVIGLARPLGRLERPQERADLVLSPQGADCEERHDGGAL